MAVTRRIQVHIARDRLLDIRLRVSPRNRLAAFVIDDCRLDCGVPHPVARYQTGRGRVVRGRITCAHDDGTGASARLHIARVARAPGLLSHYRATLGAVAQRLAQETARQDGRRTAEHERRIHAAVELVRRVVEGPERFPAVIVVRMG